jgi:DNA-3-methyladenine glycosylase
MAHVVLVRAVEPLLGLDTMLRRRNMQALSPQLTAGPGVMSQAMGLNKTYNGASMLTPDAPIWIEEAPESAPEPIASGPRIGIDYAEECALWPWRFWLKGNPWVSGQKKRQL